MASLDSCSKHNMVAYLEKTDGNTEFHQIMDFLTCSSIYYALTVSPIVLTSFIEQFWTTAKSRTVNNISYIDATVAGKPMTISEASIRSDLLFDDADGIDSMNNQALFDNIQLMGSKSTSWDQIPTNIATTGKNFSGKVTPLFDSMLVQQIEDKGEASERPSDSQPIPSPPHPSEDQPQTQPNLSPRPSPTIHIPDSIPKGSGGNYGGRSSSNRSLTGNEDGLTLQTVYDLCISLCTQVIDQAKEIKHLKEQIKKLKTKAKPVITHHKDWMKSVTLKTRLARNTSLKKKGVQKGYVSKQGRKSVKSSKVEPTVHKDPSFDDLDDNEMDYMETEDDQDEGRTSSVVLEEKESTDKEQDGGTDSTKDSTNRQGEGTTDQNEEKSATQTTPTTTSTHTPIIFGDDETIAQVLIIMSQNKQKEKEKGIDPKDKGKKMIDEEGESDTESDDITEAEKKFKMLAKDKEVARKVQEEWEAEEEKKRLAEEEATKVALTNEYDFIQARINADKILAEELQKEEREKFTIEQRAKFLHDTIAAQRKFLAQQRSEAIRNKPPTRNQLRNQMMTYLKHVGGKKHSDLKTKTFEEIQVLYERLKRQDQNFVAIGSAKDERQIKELNKDPKKKRVIKETPREEDTAKVPAEQEVTEQGTKKRKSGHVKMSQSGSNVKGLIASSGSAKDSPIKLLYSTRNRIFPGSQALSGNFVLDDGGTFWHSRSFNVLISSVSICSFATGLNHLLILWHFQTRASCNPFS
ncbi:hypothetical protein Tco_0099354 [Tanacetum coccineum]